MPKRAGFKDFFIRVGGPGAYSSSMAYAPAFGVAEKYHCHIKHAPFSMMNKIKNVVVQTWRDEDGDDVWLPRVQSSTPGVYEPNIKHDAVEYKATFAYFETGDNADANNKVRLLKEELEGRWLQIFDTYTGIGYDGVYLVDVEDDPKFKRRNYDMVVFTLTFKINGSPITSPFEEIEQ